MLRKLNEIYMDDPRVVNLTHCSQIIEIGIRGKVYDRDFLLALSDLLNKHGPTFTFGTNLMRALPYLISSIKTNIAGKNAKDVVERRANISASLTVLGVTARKTIGAEYAKHVGPHYEEDVLKAVEKI